MRGKREKKMKYNIKKLLTDYSVFYTETGPNVAKGNVCISCPWCGAADHSQHLGIRLSDGVWGCWRNDEHRGASLVYLIAELLSCGLPQAHQIAASYSEGSIPISSLKEDGMRGAIEGMFDSKKEFNTIPSSPPILDLAVPKDWLRITRGNPFTQYAVNYLKSRGFLPGAVFNTELYAALTGDQAYRIIFPVRLHNRLVAWTGRAVGDFTDLRYKSVIGGLGGSNIKDYILYLDEAHANPGPVLVHEGPMDALKSNQWLRGCGTAVALFNMTLSDMQLKSLIELGQDHKLIICMDPEAMGATLKIARTLAPYVDSQQVYLEGGGDPGALDEGGFMQAFSKFLTV